MSSSARGIGPAKGDEFVSIDWPQMAAAPLSDLQTRLDGARGWSP